MIGDIQSPKNFGLMLKLVFQTKQSVKFYSFICNLDLFHSIVNKVFLKVLFYRFIFPIQYIFVYQKALIILSKPVFRRRTILFQLKNRVYKNFKIIGVQNQLLISFCTALVYNKMLKVRN